MKTITQQWLDKAKLDLLVIERLIDTENLGDMIAFHSQQCIEKCFKAVIEEFNIDFLKIHNLERLFAMIKPHISFKIDLKTLIMLDGIYSDSRYPGLMGSLPNGLPDMQETRNFYDFAQDVFN